MYKNIGGKIKNLSEIITWLGIAASVIGGLYVMSSYPKTIFIGSLIMVLGTLTSWISQFLLYGFGELVENSSIIAGKEMLPSDKENKDILSSDKKNEIA